MFDQHHVSAKWHVFVYLLKKTCFWLARRNHNKTTDINKICLISSTIGRRSAARKCRAIFARTLNSAGSTFSSYAATNFAHHSWIHFKFKGKVQVQVTVASTSDSWQIQLQMQVTGPAAVTGAGDKYMYCKQPKISAKRSCSSSSQVPRPKPESPTLAATKNRSSCHLSNSK